MAYQLNARPCASFGATFALVLQDASVLAAQAAAAAEVANSPKARVLRIERMVCTGD